MSRHNNTSRNNLECLLAKRIGAFLLLSLFVVHCSLSQWSTDTAATKQLSPFGVNIDACTDSNGGCYIAFTNFSYVKTRYYLQHVDRFGYPQWTTPVLLSDTANLQRQCRIIPVKKFNGVVAVLVNNSVKDTIESKVFYTGKIFLQKVDIKGNKLWGANGVRASLDTNDQIGGGDIFLLQRMILAE